MGYRPTGWKTNRLKWYHQQLKKTLAVKSYKLFHEAFLSIFDPHTAQSTHVKNFFPPSTTLKAVILQMTAYNDLSEDMMVTSHSLHAHILWTEMQEQITVTESDCIIPFIFKEKRKYAKKHTQKTNRQKIPTTSANFDFGPNCNSK